MSQNIEINIQCLIEEIEDYSAKLSRVDPADDDAFLFYLDWVCKGKRLMSALEDYGLVGK